MSSRQAATSADDKQIGLVERDRHRRGVRCERA